MKDYLIIDRSKWKTGSSGKGPTYLLNEKGYMCCLGFRCHQMGIPKRDLLHIKTPFELSDMYYIPQLLRGKKDSIFTSEAIDINDDEDITSEEREKRIIKHFAKRGVTVEFKGKY